ncbi:MAG: hypothetical protein CM15mV19_0060 [uncultured marine virus]|nr:MAG: hypothetical protein CM15mV19_0060 [uncultured marine virus]
MSEIFYDYLCNSCDANYTSNEEETECFYCGQKTLVIQVKRPNIVRVRKRTQQEKVDELLDNFPEPDYEWDNDLAKGK